MVVLIVYESSSSLEKMTTNRPVDDYMRQTFKQNFAPNTMARPSDYSCSSEDVNGSPAIALAAVLN